MGKTRAQIKADIQDNLTDLAINFYSDDDLNASIQDAYDDVAILTQCIQKNTTLNWQSNLSYYNFVTLGVADYLGQIAIFNNVTNLWLRDDLNLKDFDRIRRDWETWICAPLFWAPSDPNNTAICPKYYGAGSLGTFVLYYWATAPTLMSDTDGFLIATDMQDLITLYVTGDLLEQAQEFAKAQNYWNLYYEHIDTYAARVKANCKSDLLLRV